MIDDLIRDLRKEVEQTRHSQLAMYCQHDARFGEWRPQERVRAWGQTVVMPAKVTGYEAALLCPLDVLEEIFEKDEWGELWESLDSEYREYWEHDEGRIEGLNRAIELAEEWK